MTRYRLQSYLMLLIALWCWEYTINYKLFALAITKLFVMRMCEVEYVYKRILVVFQKRLRPSFIMRLCSKYLGFLSSCVHLKFKDNRAVNILRCIVSVFDIIESNKRFDFHWYLGCGFASYFSCSFFTYKRRTVEDSWNMKNLNCYLPIKMVIKIREESF